MAAKSARNARNASSRKNGKAAKTAWIATAKMSGNRSGFTREAQDE